MQRTVRERPSLYLSSRLSAVRIIWHPSNRQRTSPSTFAGSVGLRCIALTLTGPMSLASPSVLWRVFKPNRKHTYSPDQKPLGIQSRTIFRSTRSGLEVRQMSVKQTHNKAINATPNRRSVSRMGCAHFTRFTPLCLGAHYCDVSQGNP